MAISGFSGFSGWSGYSGFSGMSAADQTINIDTVIGLQSALDGKLSSDIVKTSLAEDSDLYIPTQKAVKTAIDNAGGGGSASGIPFVAKSTLTIDLDDGDNFFVTLSADATFSLSNIADETIYNFHIVSGSGLIEVTLPNTANDKTPALSMSVRTTDASRVITMYKYGSIRYWFIGEEMS